MSTHDVPGANPANQDVLALGCWAEHDDGSLIFVESVEGDQVVYSIFDVAQDPPIEYRDAMAEGAFKTAFSWKPEHRRQPQDLVWTWHDKTPFPWDRVMDDFRAGQRPSSAVATMTAAQRVAESLELRAGQVVERHHARPTAQRDARDIWTRISDALGAFRRAD